MFIVECFDQKYLDHISEGLYFLVLKIWSSARNVVFKTLIDPNLTAFSPNVMCSIFLVLSKRKFYLGKEANPLLIPSRRRFKHHRRAIF